MAKFEVTQRGVHGVAKGEVIEIDGDKVPAWLFNKGRVLDGHDASGEVITNPAKTKKRISLEAQAVKAGLEFEGVSDDDLITAIKAAK